MLFACLHVWLEIIAVGLIHRDLEKILPNYKISKPFFQPKSNLLFIDVVVVLYHFMQMIQSLHHLTRVHTSKPY